MPVERVSLDQFTGKNEHRFSLLPRKLDTTLGSLLLPQQITVMHGTERAPMSVIAHAVCLAATRKGYMAVYLDSGNNYSPDLTRRLLDYWKMSKEVTERLAVARLKDLHIIEEIVDGIQEMDDVAIIVMDSLTSALNLTSSPASKDRQRLLFSVLESLRGLVNDTDSHLLLTDHSTIDWKRGERKPQGGNVIQHGVDSVVNVLSLDVEKDLVSIMVDQTPVVPVPNGSVFKIDHRGIRTIKAG
ncbi:MAG: hypothetical protein KAQ65_05615 [Candidatus Thorarchaeota archaeon]|nr:hypothetical protein [Candidatus Thorarchaeota archaeon]MCK5238150.1 hypothetical protein [Candidatus Thorarchaeota archaeon]